MANKISKINSLKGIPDILPSGKTKIPPTPYWHHLEKLIAELMLIYGYEEIRLPIIEQTNLFKRSIGEVTDIVEKEMFSFIREDVNIALRPEGTASCVRSCIEHSLLRNQQVQRLWYLGPMFRAERPQLGRYRQFYQLGVESFNFTSPDMEAEHIAMMARLWQGLELTNVVSLEINSLGGSEARKKHREALVAYFTKYKNQLDDDSKRRLNSNPLRILDSKEPNMQDIIKEAPILETYLEPESKEHFEQFKQELNELNIPFKINPRLVRGLDYYNRTVYEWVTSKLGSQSAICAGGRYDHLVERLGGPSAPAVGFSLGLDRVLLLMAVEGQSYEQALDGYLICVGDKAQKIRLKIAETIRNSCPNFRLLTHCGGGSFNSQFKKADRSGAKIAFIVGEDEALHQQIGIKYLREDRAQEKIPLTDIPKILGGAA